MTAEHTIPERERAVWEDPNLRASLDRGLTQIAEGKTERLDWVTAPTDEDGD